MGSGFEHYPLLWVMGVDVAVEKRRWGAYISVRIYGSLAAHAQMSSALSCSTPRVCTRVTGPFPDTPPLHCRHAD
jgi:hypothetical protein